MLRISRLRGRTQPAYLVFEIAIVLVRTGAELMQELACSSLNRARASPCGCFKALQDVWREPVSLLENCPSRNIRKQPSICFADFVQGIRPDWQLVVDFKSHPLADAGRLAGAGRGSALRRVGRDEIHWLLRRSIYRCRNIACLCTRHPYLRLLSLALVRVMGSATRCSRFCEGYPARLLHQPFLLAQLADDVKTARVRRPQIIAAASIA